MVDSGDSGEFYDRLKKFKLMWPQYFIDWIETTRGRRRSLVKTLELCMIKALRSAAGLGSPPNSWVNNVTESLHLVIKEQINNNSVDLVFFLERMKNKIFNQQIEEIIRGIHGMGEYRLIDSMSKYAVNPIQWTSMTHDQREAHVARVLKVKHKDLAFIHSSQKFYSPLEVRFEHSRLAGKLPIGTLKELWATAEFLKEHKSVINLIGGNFCVTDIDRAYNVKKSENNQLMYTCDCMKYKSLDGICSHVMVVADKALCLQIVIDRYYTYGCNFNNIMQNCAPKRSGEKCHNKKPRKGRNNVTSFPITQVNEPANNEEPHDPDLDVEKEQAFTSYWHNNDPFYVNRVLDAECKRAKRCESCLIDFPKGISKAGNDLLIIHKERYMRPDIGDDGKRRQVLTSQLGRKFYCPKKDCLLKRHPHFWKGILLMKHEVSTNLSPAHFEFLKKNLHFSMNSIDSQRL